MTPSLNAIVPMACVAAAAVAAMIAEAFRERGERMPIGGLGAVGLLGAAFATFLLWGHNTSSFGVVSGDNFGLFVTGTLIVVGGAVAGDLGADDRARTPARRRVLRADALCDGRHDADGDRHRSAGDLPRAGGDVARGLRADRHPPRLAGGDRSGVQIFPVGRLFERVLSLRHRVHLRIDRQHASRSDRPDHRVAGRWRRRRCSSSRSGCCSSGSGSRWRPSRFTCGRPTPTRAPRPR